MKQPEGEGASLLEEKTPEPSVTYAEQYENLIGQHLKRLKLEDTSTARSIIIEQFIPWLVHVESKGKLLAKNPTTSATGLIQIMKDAVIPSLNRVERYLGPLEWGAALRENDKRITEIISTKRTELENKGLAEKNIKKQLVALQRKEFQESFNLTEEQQHILLMGDLLEKTFVIDDEVDGEKVKVKVKGLGDKWWKKLLTSTDVEDRREAALQIYYLGHHTEPDEDTRDEANKFLKRFFK